VVAKRVEVTVVRSDEDEAGAAERRLSGELTGRGEGPAATPCRHACVGDRRLQAKVALGERKGARIGARHLRDDDAVVRGSRGTSWSGRSGGAGGSGH